MNKLSNAIAKIEKQQPKERTAVWMVGEQLKDILRHEPHLAELVEQDLEQEALSLANCEKQIKAYADKHKTGNFACVIPSEAERIIREFYGLVREDVKEPVEPQKSEQAPKSGGMIDLADFF